MLIDSYRLEPGTLKWKALVCTAESMRDCMIASMINCGARVDNNELCTNALNFATTAPVWESRDSREIILAFTSEYSREIFRKKFTPSVANEHMALRRRNWAAAVRRKSSGAKRLVVELNNELIHFDDIRSLVHTYSTKDIWFSAKLIVLHYWLWLFPLSSSVLM